MTSTAYADEAPKARAMTTEEGRLVGLKFKHNEGFVFSGKEGVSEMTLKDADGVALILHRVGSKNPGFVQKSRADGNAREDDLGSDLQLPRDVLVVLH